MIISDQLEILLGFMLQIKPAEATHCVLQRGNGDDEGYKSESSIPI